MVGPDIYRIDMFKETANVLPGNIVNAQAYNSPKWTKYVALVIFIKLLGTVRHSILIFEILFLRIHSFSCSDTFKSTVYSDLKAQNKEAVNNSTASPELSSRV